MTDNNKKYLINVGDEAEMWTSDMYAQKSDKLFSQYSDAAVFEVEDTDNFDEDPTDHQYIVNIGDESEVWDAEMVKTKGARLKEVYPDVKIQRVSYKDYWGERATANREQRAALLLPDADRNARLAELGYYDDLSENQLEFGMDTNLGFGLKPLSSAIETSVVTGQTKYLDPAVQEFFAKDSANTERMAEIARLDAEYESNPAVIAQREWEAQQRADQAKYIDTQLAAVRADMDSEVDAYHAAQGAQAKHGYDPYGANMTAQAIRMIQGEDVGKDMVENEKMETYQSAIKLYEMAKQANEIAGKGFWGAVGDVAMDKLRNLATQSDIEMYNEIGDILTRLESKYGSLENLTDEQIESGLSKEEQALIHGFFAYNEAMEAAGQDMSRAYKGGKIFGESISFMLEFLATGGLAGGTGKAAGNFVGKGFARWARKAAKGTVKRAFRTGVTKSARGLTTAMVGTAARTFAAPGTYKRAAEESVKIEEGHLHRGKNVFKSFVDSYIENLSEVSGGLIGKTLGKFGLAPSQWIGNVSFGKIGQLLADSRLAQGIAKGIKVMFGENGLLKKFGFNGIFEEIEEEYIGNLIREYTIQDGALADMHKDGNFGSMLIGFAPMTLFGAGISSVRMGAANIEAANLGKKVRETLGYHYKSEQIDHMMNRVRNAKNAKEVLEAINTLEGLNQEEAQLLYQYGAFMAQNKALLFAKQAQDDNLAQAKRAEFQHKYGNFWQTSEDGAESVQIAEIKDSSDPSGKRTVFVTSAPNESGMVTIIDAKTGKQGFTNVSEYVEQQDKEGNTSPMTRTWSMNAFLESRIAAERLTAQEARMTREYNEQVQNLQSQMTSGTKINLGTTGNPIWMVATGQTSKDGVFAVDSTGATHTIGWMQVADAMNQPIRVKTDQEIIDEEVAAVVARNAERRKSMRNAIPAMTEAVNESAAQTAEVVAQESKHIPMNEDGTVNEAAFWEQDPEGYAAWNDEQNQDGGADTKEQIAISKAMLTQMLGEAVAAQQNSNPAVRKQAKQNAADIQAQIDRLTALEAKYEEQRIAPFREHAMKWKGLTNAPVHIIETEEELTKISAEAAEAAGKGSRVRGMAKDGKAYIYLPGITEASEIDAVFMHEAVAHSGLKGMLGQQAFDQLCDQVWEMMSPEARQVFIGYPGVNGNKRAAADEYIAHVAERMGAGVATAEEKTIWQKIVDFVRNVLRAMGVDINVSESELADLLQLAYKDLAKNMAEAEKIAAQNKAAAKARRNAPTAAQQKYDEWAKTASHEEIKAGAQNEFDSALKEYNDLQAQAPKVEMGESVEDFIARKKAHNEDVAKAKALVDEKQTMMDEIARREKPAEGAQVPVVEDTEETAPSDERLSIVSLAESVGLKFGKVGNATVFRDTKGDIVENVTPEMVRDSRLGDMIKSSVGNGFIKAEDAEKQYKFFSDLFTMMQNIQDVDLVWATSGAIGFQPIKDTDLDENGMYVPKRADEQQKFAAITGNSDKQYAKTIDFTTICLKTQAVIDVMSKSMVQLGRGLTREEIIDVVYNETHKAGEPVPCPVCYVFSRWVGLGGLLGKMKRLQQQYGQMPTEEVAAKVKELEEEVKRRRQITEGDFASKDLAKVLGELSDKQTQLKDMLTLLHSGNVTMSTEQYYDLVDSIVAELGAERDQRLILGSRLSTGLQEALDTLESELDLYNEYAWLKKVRLHPEYKEKGEVPDDILFDINRGLDFAVDYPVAWGYRTTRGPALGKAAAPYSPLKVGQVITGIASDVETAREDAKNPFLALSATDKERKAIITKAIHKARVQNLRNGQRWQSTSDFRFEYVLDVLMGMLEMQAAGSKVQLYTKVPEAVPLFASMGAEVNCSLMPLGDGLRDGELVFSPITGMDGRDARMLFERFNNVQPIMVGISDAHIRACMREHWITFIIPYHASGGSQESYVSMMETVEEAVKDRTDYSDYQSDRVSDKPTEEQKSAREVRKAILSGAYLAQNPTKAEKETMRRVPFLETMYERFYAMTLDGKSLEKQKDYFHAFYSAGDATLGNMPIMPFEYWDYSSVYKETYEEGDIPASVNGRRFMDYCAALGVTPRFSGFNKDGVYNETKDFTNEDGYWKVLIDRSMYNRDGSYHVQRPIDITNVDTTYFTDKDGNMLPSQMSGEDAAKVLYESRTEGQGVVNPSKLNDPTKVGEITEKVLERIDEAERTRVPEMVEMSTFVRKVDERNRKASADLEAKVVKAEKKVDAAKEKVQLELSKMLDIDATIKSGTLSGRQLVSAEAKLAKAKAAVQAANAKYEDAVNNRDNLAEELAYNFGKDRTKVFDIRDGKAVLSEEMAAGLSGDTRLSVITPQMDADYLAAVERGDMETAQRMVNEAAKLAMPNTKVPGIVYHGTRSTDGGQPYNTITGGHFTDDYGFAEFFANAAGEGFVYNTFVNIERPLVYDFKGQNSDDAVDENGERITTFSIIDRARKDGNYDGVILKNVDEYGAGVEEEDGEYPGTITDIIPFSPSQIKSADPVTYDDNGNVIPLSERFNPENEDVRFSIIGEVGALRDKTPEGIARLENLDVARQMESQLNPDWSAKENEAALKIKVATGWERGADGLWRYETEDIKMKPILDWLLSKKKLKLGDIVEDGELLRLYPDLANITIVKMRGKYDLGAAYIHSKNQIELPFGALKDDYDDGYYWGGFGKASFKKHANMMYEDLIHEVQHAIQRREGFARGGSESTMNPKFRQQYNDLTKRMITIADEYNAMSRKEQNEPRGVNLYNTYNSLMRSRRQYLLGESGYKRLAGETEARNVERRKDYTPEQRRNTLLASTEDVAREDMIFIMNSIEDAENSLRFSVFEPHNATIDEIDGLFREYNMDESLVPLYDKVSALAHTMDLKIRFDYPWSAAAGSTFGDKVKFNTEFFNSLAYKSQDKAHALLHEMIHATTNYAIAARNTGALTAGMKEAVSQLESIYGEIVNDRSFDGTYGAKSIYEMVAELSNPDFRNLLKEKNLFQRIVDAIKRLLGIEVGENALDNLSATLDYMLDNYDGRVFGAVVNQYQKHQEYTRFSVVNENQAIFVSNAARAVEGIKMEKATPAQWLAMIEKSGGLKAGEDKWMGLSDWLTASDRKTLTKAEVLEFVNEHMIQIEEQHYEQYAEENAKELHKKYPGWDEAFEFEWDEYYGSPIVNIMDESNAVKLYSEHKDDTVETDEYGDIISDADYDKVRKFGQELARIYFGQSGSGTRAINETRMRFTTEGLENKREIALTVPAIEPWNESDDIHFGDAGEGRAVAWVRFGETTDESGNRVLVIDEIQSKRHQEGREQGYRQSEIQPLLDEQKRIQEEWVAHQNKLKEKFNAAKDKGEQYKFTEEDLETREVLEAKLYDIETRIKEYEAKVPAAPFEKNWHELAMKRMLRYAAENGYDVIAWTKGEQQAERYNIGKVISSIDLRPWETFDSMELRRVTYYDIRGGFGVISVDRDGVVQFATSDIIKQGDNLSDIFGKELATKILETDASTIPNVDLRFGGEGMKGFYDKMLPAFMNKYGKKWGIKVEDITLPNVEEAGRVMHSVPVTDAMKESVMEGQVMFSAVQIDPAVRQEMDTIKAKAMWDGTFMKAPNGAETNLTEDQWLMVRTKNFINWFGDWENDPENASKVVDENGEPKVVFHGSTWRPLLEEEGKAAFKQFGGMMGRGSYFTDDFTTAYDYAAERYGEEFGEDKDQDFLDDNGYITEVFLNIRNEEDIFPYGEETRYVARNANQIKSATETTGLFSESEDIRFSAVTEAEEVEPRFSVVTDSVLLDQLDNEEYITLYRAMQVVDGGLYQPMAGKVAYEEGEEPVWGDPIPEQTWLQSDETPWNAVHARYDKATKNHKKGDLKYDKEGNPVWVFKLNKGNGKSLYANYNPYIHTSFSPLNDQFSEAQDRENLVVVRVLVPKSELTSGYKAEKAHDAVGTMPWHSGPISGVLAQYEGKERVVMLTRYAKINGIVPWTEVADEAMKLFEDTELLKHPLPTNVFMKGLREELESRGVQFIKTDNGGEILEGEHKGKTWAKVYGKDGLGKKPKESKKTKEDNTRFSAITPEIDAEYLAAVERGDMETAQRMVLEAARLAMPNTKVVDENGYPKVVRHISENLFTEFEELNPMTGTLGFFTDAIDEVDKYIDKHFSWAIKYDSFLNIENPKIVDFKGQFFWAYKDEQTGEELTTDLIAGRAKRDGVNDGVIMLNVGDEFAGNLGTNINDFVPFYPSQIKSADPVTYDDEGNVIPLSERFNPEKSDIRFSAISTPTDNVVAEGMKFSIQDFARLAGNIFQDMPESFRKQAIEETFKRGWDMQSAIFQIPARLAEKENWDESDKDLAKVIREKVQDAMDESGVVMSRPLTTKEALWMLYRSTEANSDSMLDAAKRSIVASNLGFDRRSMALKKKADDIIRYSVVRNRQFDEATEMYNFEAGLWTNRLDEVWRDMHKSVIALQDALEKASGKAIAPWENIVLALNQLSSKSYADKKKYMRDYLAPLWDIVLDLAKTDGKGKDIESVERYMMLKHGLERNKKLAMRDAKQFYREMYDKVADRMKSTSHAEQVVALSEANKRMADIDAEMATAKGRELRELQEARERAAVEKRIAELVLRNDEQQNEADLQMYFNAIEAENNPKYAEFREKDYGGLTSMFQETIREVKRRDYKTQEAYQQALLASVKPMYDTVAEMEQAAKDEVSQFEEDKEDKINELWTRVNAATKEVLRHQHASGVISTEQYDAVRNMFEFYVPLRGFSDNTAADMYSYYMENSAGGFAKPIMAAKGRKTRAESPLGWIGTMAESAIQQDNKNEVKMKLYYALMNRPDTGVLSLSEMWYVYDHTDTATGKKVFVPAYPPATDGMLTADQMRQHMDAWEDSMKAKQAIGEAYKREPGVNLGGSVIFQDTAQDEEHIIRVKVAGKDYAILVNGNPRAAQSINGLLNPDANENVLEKVIGMLRRGQSALLTSASPLFWLGNFQRDLLSSFMRTSLSEGWGQAFKYLVNRAKAWRVAKYVYAYDNGTMDDSYFAQLYKEFAENGGITGYTVLITNKEYEQLLKDYAKNVDRKVLNGFKNAWEKVMGFGEAIEQVSRFAAYITAREAGKSIEESVAAAKEVSVNFNRKGSRKPISKAEAEQLMKKNGQKLNTAEQYAVMFLSSMPWLLNFCYFFLNASIQATTSSAKLMWKNKGKMAAWAGMYFGTGLIMGVINAMLGDDDEYYDMPDYLRQSTFLIKVADGYYLKWSIPQEMRPFFAWGDLIARKMKKGMPHKNLGKEMALSLMQWLPVNPFDSEDPLLGLAPDWIAPEVEAYKNKTSFGGRIYKDFAYMPEGALETMPRYKKATSKTGKVYVELAELLNDISGGDEVKKGAININPAVVEHIVSGHLGGMYDLATMMVDIPARALSGEEIRIKDLPFVNKIIMSTDEANMNSYVNEVYNYYQLISDRAQYVENGYYESEDPSRATAYRKDEDWRVHLLFKQYEEDFKDLKEKLGKAADDTEKELIREQQNALRQQLLNDIANGVAPDPAVEAKIDVGRAYEKRSELMAAAKEASKSGDPQAIEQAQKALADYVTTPEFISYSILRGFIKSYEAYKKAEKEANNAEAKQGYRTAMEAARKNLDEALDKIARGESLVEE